MSKLAIAQRLVILKLSKLRSGIIIEIKPFYRNRAMGLSIKNDEVEALVREYARTEGLGVTEAVARAIQVASSIERQERSRATRDESIRRFLEIADKGWSSGKQEWTRDELHER